MTRKKHVDYETSLDIALQDPEKALAYLNASLKDADARVFLLALKDVLRAQNVDVKAFAQESDLNRTNVYRMLSPTGNPRWDNLKSLIDTMGLDITLNVPRK